jgi:hypothetical protein
MIAALKHIMTLYTGFVRMVDSGGERNGKVKETPVEGTYRNRRRSE